MERREHWFQKKKNLSVVNTIYMAENTARQTPISSQAPSFHSRDFVLESIWLEMRIPQATGEGRETRARRWRNRNHMGGNYSQPQGRTWNHIKPVSCHPHHCFYSVVFVLKTCSFPKWLLCNKPPRPRRVHDAECTRTDAPRTCLLLSYCHPLYFYAWVFEFYLSVIKISSLKNI